MIGERVKDFLIEHGVQFEIILHRPAYTAYSIARSAHVRDEEMIKTVILKINGNLAMVALPASQNLNLRRICKKLSAQEVTLAREEEFETLFDDCEPGAMPPFGNLYGIKEFIAEELTRDDDIVFNAGSHSQLIKMKFKDFQRLTGPTILDVH